MKPFDLEKALAGEPVILRRGNKAFITVDLRSVIKGMLVSITRLLFIG